MPSDGFHYHILRASHEKQHEICNQLQLRLPTVHGRVFLPMWEYYRRDRECIEKKPMFIGYIFVRTDLVRSELYDICRSLARPVRAHLENDVNNLWTKEDDSLLDLTEDEEAFFDAVLDDAGIERMSRGYIGSDGRAVVMEGPLKELADRIAKLDKRNWLAWLDMKVGDQLIKAGLEICERDIWSS